MDGLLINTEELYTIVTNSVLETFGTSFNMEIKAKIMGRKPHDAAKLMLTELNIIEKVSPEEYLELAEKHMQLHFPNAKLLPGVEKLILHLKANNIPIAISTGSSNDSFDLKTKNLKNFFNMFDHVVKCGSDPEVKNGKPAPDAFEVARLRFSPQPKASSCLAFEDAPNGVESALKAGMQVIMIPDPSTPLSNIQQPTLILKSMEDFRPEIFGLPPF